MKFDDLKYHAHAYPERDISENKGLFIRVVANDGYPGNSKGGTLEFHLTCGAAIDLAKDLLMSVGQMKAIDDLQYNPNMIEKLLKVKTSL